MKIGNPGGFLQCSSCSHSSALAYVRFQCSHRDRHDFVERRLEHSTIYLPVDLVSQAWLSIRTLSKVGSTTTSLALCMS